MPSIFDDDLKPLYEIIDIIFTDRIEPDLIELHKKYKETMLISASSRNEFDEFVKTYAKLIFSYLSRRYIKTLNEYYNTNGVIFLIITIITVKSKIFYTSLD